MPTPQSVEQASQCWCDPRTENLVMQTELAYVFAELLDKVKSEPWLGNATTGDLLNELKARAIFNGTLDYKTVDND